MDANKNLRVFRPKSRQRGLSTLLIAILLLAIVTIMTLFAARFGIFEQRMSANDYRYKMAFQVSEAGLNQSMEFIKMSTAEMLSTVDDGWLSPTAPRWEPCTSPLPEGMDVDPCMAEPLESRRDDMYRYVGPDGDGILPVSGLMPALAEADDALDEFAAEYSSYATLCRLDMTIPEAPRCALVPTTGDTFYVTVVSRGTLPDENAVVTTKQSFGTFRTIGNAPDAPLIAAGAVLAVGSAEIVPNPNAGGFGVPVSIWSAENAHVSKDDPGSASNGSFATCQLGEWLTTGTPESVTDGICSDCSCGSLTVGYGKLSAGGSDKVEGPDILDSDGGHSEATPKVLHDGGSFPDDLFLYTFATPNEDAVDFLTANATRIVPPQTCQLGITSGGLYWWDSDTDCKITAKVGSLSDPVVLVSDGKVELGANAEFYGIIFVRDDPTAPVSGDLLKASGTPQVYGSVILQGEGSLQGGAQIIYNKAVLQNVRNSPNFLRYGPVPGSWADTLQ